MKFSQTESAKEYGLTVNDVTFDVTIEPMVSNPKSLLLIVPNNDEFPIEVIKFDSESDAIQQMRIWGTLYQLYLEFIQDLQAHENCTSFDEYVCNQVEYSFYEAMFNEYGCLDNALEVVNEVM